MFLDELTPVLQELVGHPVAFLGGFASGVLKINLSDDPVKSWLTQQGAAGVSTPTDSPNGKSTGPQTIEID
ncbi:MAG: hypothetical protein ACTS2F_26690 [Thainema sp.]